MADGRAEELVRRVWQATARGDRAGAAALFSRDLVWHLDAGPEHAMSGDYTGWRENAHLQRLISEESRGTFHAEATSIRSAGPELVVATISVRLEVSGGEVVTMRGVWVARTADGLVAEVWDIVRPVPASVLAEARRAVQQLGRLP